MLQNNDNPLNNFFKILLQVGGVILIAYLLAKLFEYLLKEPTKEKSPRIFISHSWENDKDYWTLIKKFQNHGFEYYNHSIPEEKAIDESKAHKIEEGIRNKIKGCSKILVLGGDYANNYWIKKEVEIASELQKKVIAIRPWGKDGIPEYLKRNADQIIGFNSKSIIEKIKG